MINRNLGGIICDNTGITNVPADVFLHQSSESFVDCKQVARLDGNVIEELLKGGSPMKSTTESLTESTTELTTESSTVTTHTTTTTSSTVTKVSKESNCDHWASQGYCTHTFASWMIVNCREACGSKIKP